MSRSRKGSRVERDPMGELEVPSEALYGIQTARALENFQISELRVHPALVTAMAEIKLAAILTHRELDNLPPEVAEALEQAAREVIAGQHREHFRLDVFQAGAGTSHHMNMNEVLANLALDKLGRERGDYDKVQPNDDVNQGQSTNDVFPTAMRVAALRLSAELRGAVASLASSLDAKAGEFAQVKKSGRTHLHDALPMTLGQEFGAWGHLVRRGHDRLAQAELALREIPLGGAALGTGAPDADPRYAPRVVQELSRLTGLELQEARDKVAATQSLGDFVALSAALRGLCVELVKITSDLRLLSSGPRTGLDEIELPATQPGSSIMPGKVNPAMAEMLAMVCFHVMGHDAAISQCGQVGQLELNVTMPYVAYALLESLAVLTRAVATFDERCARVITAHPERCAFYAEQSVGNAAMHNDDLGFLGAAELAERALEKGKTVEQLIRAGDVPKKQRK
jgi:aspartate ammonia-lyase